MNSKLSLSFDLLQLQILNLYMDFGSAEKSQKKAAINSTFCRQSEVGVGGLFSWADRKALANKGGLLTGKWMIMQMNFNDLTILPASALTIKETKF